MHTHTTPRRPPLDAQRPVGQRASTTWPCSLTQVVQRLLRPSSAGGSAGRGPGASPRAGGSRHPCFSSRRLASHAFTTLAMASGL